MSVNVLSIGNFDFSYFQLSEIETIIVRTIINYDLNYFLLTKNINHNQIIFLFNSSNLKINNCEALYSKIFDLLEVYYLKNKLNKFSVNLFSYFILFNRTTNNANNEVTWEIKINNLQFLKNELFDFYFNSKFYQSLATSLPIKNLKSKLIKI